MQPNTNSKQFKPTRECHGYVRVTSRLQPGSYRQTWTEAAARLPLSSPDTQHTHTRHNKGGNSLSSKEPDSCPHSNPRILESARPGSGVKLKHKVTRNTPGPRAIARGHYTACNHTVHWNSILPQNCILTKLSPDTTHCSVTTV